MADPVDTVNSMAGDMGANPISADVAAALARAHQLPPGVFYGGGNPAQMRDPAVAAVGNIAPVVIAPSPSAAAAPPAKAAVVENPALAPIRQRESGGNPYVGYGGVDLSKAPLGPNGFPLWEGRMGPAGVSHAAGIYQIEPDTWNPIAAELGITDFSPQSQTRVANEIYKRYGVAPWDASAPGSSGRGGYGNFVRQQIQSENQAYSQHQAQIQQYLAQNRYVSEEQPKWTFKPPEFDAMKAFGSTASVLGILMGALTRGGITASLNASASAMTAIRQNDLMAYKEAKDTWEKNTELTIKNAKAHNEAVNRGLEIAKSDWGEYSAHMARVGALYGDLAKYEDPEAVEGRLIQRQTALLKFQQAQRDAQIELDNNLVDLNRAAEILGVKPEDLKTANPAQVAQARETARLERAAAENAAMKPGQPKPYMVNGKLVFLTSEQLMTAQATPGVTIAPMEKQAAAGSPAAERQSRYQEIEAQQKANGTYTGPSGVWNAVNQGVLISKSATLPEETARMIAERAVKAGDFSGLTGFGRSPAALRQIDTEIARLASEKGLSGVDLAKMKANFAAYAQGVKAFTAGGKLEPAMRSLGVVNNHLDTLLSVANKFTAGGRFPALNDLENRALRQMGWNGDQTFDAIKSIVGSEITKAVQGSAGAVVDRKEIREALKASSNPEVLRDTVAAYQSLMNGQMQGLKQSYLNLQNIPGSPGVPFESLLGRALSNTKPAPPQEAQDILIANPTEENKKLFDQHFGEGASDTVLGDIK